MGQSLERFVVGLVGADIGSSLSPALHERAADELGLRYVYLLLDTDELGVGVDEVGHLLAQARRLGFAALYVTHPYKVVAAAQVDQLSADAARLGAVNTVLFQAGRTLGHNTDWSGFAAAFARDMPGAAVEDVVLLGAGGAGSAVALAIIRAGARRLTIVDPDLERARRVADAMPGPTIEVAGSVDAVADRIAGADGLVNASPVGMTSDDSLPMPVELLRPTMWVVDIVYRPLETPLLRHARAIGCRTANGCGMLAFQAAEGFRLVTGIAPDAERMYRHLTELTASN